MCIDVGGGDVKGFYFEWIELDVDFMICVVEVVDMIYVFGVLE